MEMEMEEILEVMIEIRDLLSEMQPRLARKDATTTLTQRQACLYLGMSQAKIRRMSKDGLLHPIKTGSSRNSLIKYKITELNQYR